ncbi:rhodanese-like domain-containing protein [Roseospira marina]|uniref:Rhodanese-like domain-containing protein n=2 Tax=Roseospira marina TaxID=140057 RepID=A0A5M6ICW7_9PROT|nr:rhodanese-like domain-containing protein [Roseospira marina]
MRTPFDADTLARARDRVHLVDAATALDWYTQKCATVVDVREDHEYARGHIPGATNRPLSAFDPQALPPVPEGGRLVLHCAIGVRCEHAAMALMQAGHPGPIHRIEGGLAAWQAAGGPIEADAGSSPPPVKNPR